MAVHADRQSLTIPADPSLAGVTFFAQWWTTVRDSYTGALYAAASSNGAVLVIGL